DDLGRRDDRALTADEGRERDRDLVVLDPDVLGLARHVTEPRVLDEEPARLGRLDRDRGLGRGLHAEGLTHGPAPGEQREEEQVPGETPLHQAKDSTARASVRPDRKSTRLNSSHVETSYAVCCLKKKAVQT